MPFAATWLGPTDSHTEWSRLEREWQIWYCLYVEPQNGLQMNLSIIYIENKLMVPEAKGERDKLEDWSWHMHTTILKLITTKHIPYRIGILLNTL